MAHEVPPPAVLRSQRGMNTGNGATNGATNDAFGNTDEWQPIDYWYNRVLSKSSPAANTANPSALGLIAFGYTTALLQVRAVCVCLGSCVRVALSSVVVSWRHPLDTWLAVNECCFDLHALAI